jgi:hypothetical protein
MPDGDVPNITGLTADEAALVALGYKQEFKREFSLWTTFCVSFAVLGLLPSFASTLTYGMGYAGTGGMVWGWLIGWFFIQCVAMGMAELCSSMPTRYVVLGQRRETVLTREQQRRSLLRLGRPGPPWMGSLRGLGHWLVELDGADYGRALCRLCPRGHDPGGGLHHTPRLCTHELPDLPPYSLHHGHPRLHFEHADAVDRQFQLLRLDPEHGRPVGCHYHDPFRGHGNRLDS